jgi:heme-degrading monooxygenase HmoA
MYVRVLNFVCRKETQKEQIQSVYRLMIKEARDIDGFIGGTLLMQETACDGMALMYWKDEAAAAAAGPILVEVLAEHIYSLLDTPPEIRGYHVVENGIKPEDL